MPSVSNMTSEHDQNDGQDRDRPRPPDPVARLFHQNEQNYQQQIESVSASFPQPAAQSPDHDHSLPSSSPTINSSPNNTTSPHIPAARAGSKFRYFAAPPTTPYTLAANDNAALSTPTAVLTLKLTVHISFDDCREIGLFGVQPADKVADVIAKIRAQEGIDDNIHLYLYRNSRLLYESKALAECDRNGTLILSTVGPLGLVQTASQIGREHTGDNIQSCACWWYRGTTSSNTIAANSQLMKRKTTDEDDPSFLSVPPDVQKLILSHLSCEELLRLRVANTSYLDKISNDCQDFWNSRIASLWTYGKGMANENNREFIKWSQENNMNVHRANTEISGFQEFVRRRRLDHSVLERLTQLDVGPSMKDLVMRRVPLQHMKERMENHNWIPLMEDGEDIIDHLNYIIRRLEDCTSREKQSQDSETTYEKSRIERRCEEFKCDPLQIIDSSKRVLNGIYRLHSYQQWKFINAKTTDPQLIETGASIISKFYLTSSLFHKEVFRIQSVDDEIDSRLCELADAVKSGLEKRLGHGTNFPLMEVVQEMQSVLFGDDSPHKFITTHYFYQNFSLLHEVLTKRTGIPTTLAIIYTAVVRRVCGVCLDLIVINEALDDVDDNDTPWLEAPQRRIRQDPGHVVIGLPFDEGTPLAERVFVDVLRGGKLLSYSDYLMSIDAQNGLTWSDEIANPISHQLVWERMSRHFNHCTCAQTFREMILAPGFSAYTH